MTKSAEWARLEEAQAGAAWRRWGPYLSERQWGTVREDYSDDGDAWNYFTHDQARSRAYRWGEDGLAGVCDDRGLVCLALALWNESDPILKERLFGLTNTEGNHGEDVKEYYFYVDSTPTHSWMRWRYKYPQTAFPYNDLVRTNAERGFGDLEYELVDTGVFDDGKYFDVQVDYAKAGVDDLLARVTVTNRSAQDAPIHVLPTLWFRNTWSWGEQSVKPTLRAVAGGAAVRRGAPRRRRRLLAQPALPRRPAVLRERDEQPAAVGPTERLALRQGRRRPGGGPRREGRGERRARHQGRRTLAGRRPGRRHGDPRPAARRARPGGAGTLRRLRRGAPAAGRPRQTSTTPRSPRPRSTPTAP